MIDLKTFRKANHLTQIDLADYLGVGQGFISQIEKGDRPLPRESISRILANPYGWDVTMLTSDQPKNPAEEKPEDTSMVDRLFALLQEEQASNKILLQLLREKEEKIEALQEELRAYREHKGETAQNAGNSSAASAV